MNGASGRWNSFPLEGSRAVELAAELERMPISLWWTEFDSTDPDEYAVLIEFLTQPLTFLVELPGVTESWNVVTNLNNHHRRLNPRIHILVVTVAPDEETCYVTFTKQNDHQTQ